ncbi:MobA/MobL family protein, partial [Salmonella enterica]|uniref:MobA/MobL family protein n=1 Tax=Salmonella enterica TaxID=28901 RepID=UPI0034D00DC9
MASQRPRRATSSSRRCSSVRGRWEAKANEHLERAGQRERIDMRSYTAQGKDAIPEKKQLP